MEFLEYIKLANSTKAKDDTPVKLSVVTNFTDAMLVKTFTGVLLSEGVTPEIFAVPYKQYHLHLKDRTGPLYEAQADLTFIFFDINSYRRSAFTEDREHVAEVLSDIKEYCVHTKAPVVVSSFALPYAGGYGNLFAHDPLYQLVRKANGLLEALAEELPNLYVCDTNALVHRHGERALRDFRGLYAFDVPFTNDFIVELAREWASYVRAKLGRTKKCIVLDLDNTLWGGVVGEVGPLGIAVGPDYPGLAFQNFQHALLSLYGRGIILAVNSRNNPEDVAEVFAKNPHMALKENHFAASRVNWNDKAKNLMELAEELNIGLDSMVFLDDDAVNRDLVRSLLPQVSVPELPPEPELYVPMLYALNVFNQFALTEEDRKRVVMYQEERQRREVKYSTQNLDEYIAALGITVNVKKNDTASSARLSQLTQKTNQFNITTRRYTEKEILAFIEEGALIFSGDVADKFGEYGKTIMAIVTPVKDGVADLDTFLMSCRIMGRRVEYGFMGHIGSELAKAGVKQLTATFIPSPKNIPAADFLPSLGFSESKREGDTVQYVINVLDLVNNASRLNSSLSVQ